MTRGQKTTPWSPGRSWCGGQSSSLMCFQWLSAHRWSCFSSSSPLLHHRLSVALGLLDDDLLLLWKEHLHVLPAGAWGNRGNEVRDRARLSPQEPIMLQSFLCGLTIKFIRANKISRRFVCYTERIRKGTFREWLDSCQKPYRALQQQTGFPVMP